MEVDAPEEQEIKRNATIEKLVIQGIRAFGPKNPQTIEFYSPLTMIVGQNGCGKTTIIECLKYITTGTLPPGTKSGHSFINDPSMTDTAEVKASIKLRFVNTEGRSCVTARTMSLTKKKTKMEFKSLDGTLKTTTNRNEKVSTTMKCSDLDAVISNSLGVTAAILENVIFCHQEESNWPMLEGITLKKKLDDIFESTRYTKALEAFQKAKKTFQGKAKDLKSEQKELAAHLSAADSFKAEELQCTENLKECHDALKKAIDGVERAEDKATRFRENIQKMESSKEELSKLQQRIEFDSAREKEQSRKLEREYTESDDALAELLQDFDAKMQRKEGERRDLQRSIDGLSSEASRIREEIDELNIKKGVADSLHEHFKSTEAKFADVCKAVCLKCDLQRPTLREGANYKPQAARDFLNLLNSRMAQIEQESDEGVGQLRKITIDADKAVGEVREKAQRYELELEAKVKEIRKLQGEMDMRQNSINSAGGTSAVLGTLEREYEEKKAELDHFEQSHNAKMEDFKVRIRDASAQISHLTDDIDTDTGILNNLNMRRGEIMEVEADEKQIVNELQQVKTDAGQAFRNHAEILDDAVSPNSPDDIDLTLQSLAERVEAWKAELRHKKTESDDEIRNKATVDAQLKDLRDKVKDETAVQQQYRNAEQQFEAFALKVKDLLGGFGEGLLAEVYPNADRDITDSDGATTAINAAYKLLGRIRGNKDLQKRAQKKLEKVRAQALADLRSKTPAAQNACPCCAQSVTAAQVPEVNERVNRLFKTNFDGVQEAALRDLEDKTDGLTTDLRDLDGPVRKLTQAKALIKEHQAKILSIEAENAPHSLALRAARIKDDIAKLDTQISSGDKVHSILSEHRIRWRSLLARKKENADRKEAINKSQFGSVGDARKPEEIERLQQDRLKRKQNHQLDKDKLTKDEADQLKNHYTLKSMVQEREKSLIEARKKSEKVVDDTKALKELSARCTEAENQKRQLTAERDETTRLKSDQERNRTSARTKYEDANQVARAKMEDMRGLRGQIQQHIDSMNETFQKLSNDNIKNSSARIDELQQRIAKINADMASLSPQISSINSDLMNQEHTKRVVRDNVELRKARKDLEAAQAALQSLRDKKGLDERLYSESQRDLQRAEQERNRAASEKATLAGKIEIYQEQLKDIKAKLNGPNYREVGKKHRRTSIQYETTELAVRDLDSYYNALDKALQNYHSLKIREINKIIRELWQLIYKGQDIDMIRLESGEEEGAAATKATRSYNYRVVMCKGDTPLDMRGRCSAGQRVLAAIVIRLALAETFCLNCGILALDEPTTNLDEPNKAGLAHALARIIISRSAQQNFQLIVITHDEDFVKLMNAELSSNADFSLPDYYFKISREESPEFHNKMFSSISRIAWGDNV